MARVSFTVEYPMLLLLFGFMISGVLNTNLVLYKTCLVTLGYNETVCRTLLTNLTDNTTQEIEKVVQTHATYILTCGDIIGNIVPAILCLFLGPWSDKHGRKPLMIMSFSAFIVADMTRIFISAIPYVSPWFLLISNIIAVCTGGFATYFSAVICYITDTSSKEKRGLRMGILEGFMGLGLLTGTMSTSYIFNAIDFIGCYTISISCIVLSILITAFFVPESINSEDTLKEKIYDIFKIKHMKMMMHTTFKQREFYTRAILMCLVMMTLLNVLNVNGDTSILYLYIREKFHWDLTHYTFYKAGSSVCLIVGAIFGIYILHKLLKVQESPLIVMGIVSLIIGLTIQGLACKNWHLYLAGAVRSLSAVLSPMMRSLMSKIVPTEDLGKIFPFTIALEGIITLIAAPLYTILYNSTISTFPGAFNFFTVGINTFNLIFAIAVIYYQKRQPAYQQVDEQIINE